MAFKAGVSGNPSGRPKETEEIRKAKEDIRALLPEAVLELQRMLKDSNPKLKTWAMEKVLEYGLGKPAQAVELSGKNGVPLAAAIRIVSKDA